MLLLQADGECQLQLEAADALYLQDFVPDPIPPTAAATKRSFVLCSEKVEDSTQDMENVS